MTGDERVEQDQLPEKSRWEREKLGSDHYVWSRRVDEDELAFDPSEFDLDDEMHVLQVELLWLNDEWNATLSKPNPRRGFLDVVTPDSITSNDLDEALNHVQYLLDEEAEEGDDGSGM